MAEPDRSLLTTVRRRARAVGQAEIERDSAIRAAHEAGFTMRQIAAEAGLTHQRVHQIVRKQTVKAA